MTELHLTPVDDPSKILGNVVLNDDRASFTGATEAIFRSYQSRLKGGKATDAETFDVLKAGWSNGYIQLITPKEK